MTANNNFPDTLVVKSDIKNDVEIFVVNSFCAKASEIK